MSDSNGPVRRRRIAGEPSPAAPAKKAPSRKPVVKKPVAKKAAPPREPSPRTAPAVKTPAASTAASGPGHGPGRRELRWLVPAAVGAIALLVAGALLLVRGLSSDDDGSGSNLATAQRQASAAASTAAETIFSYRYDKLPEHLTESKALMTPSFAKDFDKIAPALDEIAPQRKVQVQAVARGAAALSCGDECSSTKVDVLVFLDQARLVTGTKQPEVLGNRISVSMVKRDGGWLVNNIRAL